mmetsp:Transcript_7900/g.23280  ORF Transcript_7900/g.23280 Transcript_7900/m.23280 type:complete len:223 (+) Transcript_7900:237-905(+)
MQHNTTMQYNTTKQNNTGICIRQRNNTLPAQRPVTKLSLRHNTPQHTTPHHTAHYHHPQTCCGTNGSTIWPSARNTFWNRTTTPSACRNWTPLPTSRPNRRIPSLPSGLPLSHTRRCGRSRPASASIRCCTSSPRRWSPLTRTGRHRSTGSWWRPPITFTSRFRPGPDSHRVSSRRRSFPMRRGWPGAGRSGTGWRARSGWSGTCARLPGASNGASTNSTTR